MKTLQNNYTTPEQSKRLLELGVPADSADCYFNRYNHRTEIIDLYDTSWAQTDKAFAWCECFVPIWSVGRLMEIYYIARCAYSIEYVYYDNTNMIDDMIRRFEFQKGKLDFSKLED